MIMHGAIIAYLSGGGGGHSHVKWVSMRKHGYEYRPRNITLCDQVRQKDVFHSIFDTFFFTKLLLFLDFATLVLLVNTALFLVLFC